MAFSAKLRRIFLRYRKITLHTNGGRKTMDGLLNSVTRIVSGQWAHATPTDFGALALAIVLTAWFCTRFYGER